MQPDGSLYSRQQLGELAGLDDTTLNYWSREGLLVPTEGGQGRGSHRRFDFVQVNIAAILGQMRRFRLSLPVMRSFADLLQQAAVLGKGRELHPGNYTTATELADKLELFRKGGEIEIHAHPRGESAPDGLTREEYIEWSSAKRSAVSEEEVVRAALEFCDHDPPEAIISFAKRVGPGHVLEAQLYAELVYDILAPGYNGAYSWILGFGPNDSWRVEFGMEASFFNSLDGSSPEDFGPGIFLPVSGIIRQTWGLKTPGEYMRDRRANRIRDVLSKAGITATVWSNSGDIESYSIDALDVPWDEVEAALSDTGYLPMSRSEGTDQ